ncbi:hypothetical protein DFQ13_110233 [Actinokineospora spheciospongiae]|nr:hypothetical protein DFQ13_110233 [Actinokineospora spheciospongiae]
MISDASHQRATVLSLGVTEAVSYGDSASCAVRVDCADILSTIDFCSPDTPFRTHQHQELRGFRGAARMSDANRTMEAPR